MRVSPLTHHIAACIYLYDSYCRCDLANRIIISEEDYTSNLCSYIRHYCCCFPSFISIFSRKLDKSEEGKFGCDAIFLLKIGNKIKVGLFEAKWPRIIFNTNYAWDWIQQNKISHFNNQLTRQHKWTKYAAIWEMFYYESPVGNSKPPFDKYGSTCVWHNIAYQYSRQFISLPNQIWNNEHLINMLRSRPTNFTDPNYATNLRYILIQLLSCRKGKLINIIDKDSFILPSNDGEEITIPLPITRSGRDKIDYFMKASGILNYIYLDIETIYNGW